MKCCFRETVSTHKGGRGLTICCTLSGSKFKFPALVLPLLSPTAHVCENNSTKWSKQHCGLTSFTGGSENISKVQTVLQGGCLMLHTDTHSVKDEEQDWHNDMFIERLWIIEKVVAAAGISQPLTKTWTLSTHTHTHIHSRFHSRHSTERKTVQQCTGQDDNHSFHKHLGYM